MTSRTTRSTFSSPKRRSASSPSRAWTTRYPSRSSGNVRSVWIESSSSTRRIVEGELGIGAFARARGCQRAYYSPAMEAARPLRRGRRRRRGTVDSPLNTRLVRVGIHRRRSRRARAPVLDLDNRNASSHPARATVRGGFGRRGVRAAVDGLPRSRTRHRRGARTQRVGTARPSRHWASRPRRTSGPRTSPISAPSSFATWSQSYRVEPKRPSCSLLIATTQALTGRWATTRPARPLCSSSRADMRPRTTVPIRYRNGRSFWSRPMPEPTAAPARRASRNGLRTLTTRSPSSFSTGWAEPAVHGSRSPGTAPSRPLARS